MKSISRSLALVLFACIFSNCSNSKTANITLVTGLENQDLPNFMKNMSSPHKLAALTTCLQKNLFYGMKRGDSDLDIETYPIDMRTLATDPAPTIDPTWLTTNASFTPIKISVTKGSLVEFGILGSIIAANHAETDGTCAPFTIDGAVNPTYSVIGHRKAYVTSDAAIPLNVWVLNAASTPSPNSAPGGPDCNGGGSKDSLNPYCPALDFGTYTCINCPGPVKFEYVFGMNRTEHTTQFVTAAQINTTTGVSIADIDHVVVTLMNASNTDALTSVTIDHPTLSQAGTVDFPLTFTGGSATLTLNKPNRASRVFTWASGLNSPGNMAFNNSTGDLYIADTANHVIQKITPSGTMSIFAGRFGIPGHINASPASFNGPTGLAYNQSTGDLYVADTGNHIIRKITATGTVSTYAGFASSTGTMTGTATGRFNSPSGIVLDPNNDLIVADTNNHAIRKVTYDATSNSGMVNNFAGSIGTSGFSDGPASAAFFYGPAGVSIDAGNNIIVADTSNHVIRKIAQVQTMTNTSIGTSTITEVSTIAGVPNSSGSNDGIANTAKFTFPHAVSVDSFGNIFVADTGNNLIRRVGQTSTNTGSGTNTVADVSTFAGTGTAGSNDDFLLNSSFNAPAGIIVGANGTIYVSDTSNSKIRIIH